MRRAQGRSLGPDDRRARRVSAKARRGMGSALPGARHGTYVCKLPRSGGGERLHPVSVPLLTGGSSASSSSGGGSQRVLWWVLVERQGAAPGASLEPRHRCYCCDAEKL